MFGVLWRSFPLRCAVLANLFPMYFPPFFRCVGMSRLLGLATGALEQKQAVFAHAPAAFFGQLLSGVFLLRFHSAALRALEVGLALLAVDARAPNTLRPLRL